MNRVDPAPIRAPDTDVKPLLYIVGDCHVRLWGLGARERIQRAFALADVSATIGLESGDLPGGVIVIGAEWVLDPGLVQNLMSAPNIMLVAHGTDDGPRRVVLAHLGTSAKFMDVRSIAALVGQPPPSDEAAAKLGLRVVDAPTLCSAYNQALRKRETPYVFSLLETLYDQAEKQTFRGSYKGVTDFVTKWVWPGPALHVTRWAAERRITPNSVTTASLVLVILAAYLFSEGHFLTGLAAGWGMTFLDTVDGKLARVTMTSSKWGNVYDHGIDLIHPPIWWAAWWWGLYTAPAGFPDSYLNASLWIILIGYVLGRLIEGSFLLHFSFEIHTWRPIDSLMRLYTARRNPNLVLLTAATVFSRPDLGFHAVAAWVAICLAFHLVRLGHAMVRSFRGRSITSWLAERPKTASTP